MIFYLSVNVIWAVNVPFPWKQTPHIFIILFLQAYQSISKHNIKKLVFLPVNVKIISYSAQIDHILTSSRRRVSSFRLSKSTQIIFIFIRSYTTDFYLSKGTSRNFIALYSKIVSRYSGKANFSKEWHQKMFN